MVFLGVHWLDNKSRNLTAVWDIRSLGLCAKAGLSQGGGGGWESQTTRCQQLKYSSLTSETIESYGLVTVAMFPWFGVGVVTDTYDERRPLPHLFLRGPMTVLVYCDDQSDCCVKFFL